MGIFSKIFISPIVDQVETFVKQGAVLLDVRSASEFASGSAQGALNIPLEQLNHSLNQLNPNQHIVVFCRTGNRSGMAKTILEHHGFMNVVNGKTWQNVNKILNENK